MNAPRLIVRGMAAGFVLTICLGLLPGTYILGGRLIQVVRGELTLLTLFGLGVGSWMVFYGISLIVGNRIVVTENEILISVHTPTLGLVPRFLKRRLSLPEISEIFIGRRGDFKQQIAEEMSIPNPYDAEPLNRMIMLVRTKTTGSFAVSMLPFPKSRVRALTELLRLQGLSVSTAIDRF